MIKQHLQVFTRVKPLFNDDNSQQYNHKWVINSNKILIESSRNKLSNAKDQQEFIFTNVFNQDSTQEQIFLGVAKPVIDNCLEGYNGTIFTYGQTGSGKTFTMSGGDTWAQRGITPRVLTYIFEEFQRKSHQYTYQLHVSFIQIYNENAYDLLDPKHVETNFQSWSKIVFMEDQEGNLQMKNVETHICSNQKDGIDYLMMGNYIKKISSTNLNQTSSRSHCIFTLNIRGTNKNTLNQVFSKIHLVDLAGSQRVSKSQAQGLLLTEAKSINLSLTYLQQVIVALNQKIKPKSKVHIPYRNSLLTTLLKDSLGGNCKTVMIATITLESKNIQQSLSTLRFSQRVRQIQNQICKNQTNLYSNKIQQLQRQNKLLKKKLALLQKGQNGIQPERVLSRLSQNQQTIRKNIDDFISQKKCTLEVGSVVQAQYYFQRIRDTYNRRMRQYVSQLTFISEKLAKYDQILSRKQMKRRSPHDIFNI